MLTCHPVYSEHAVWSVPPSVYKLQPMFDVCVYAIAPKGEAVLAGQRVFDCLHVCAACPARIPTRPVTKHRRK